MTASQKFHCLKRITNQGYVNRSRSQREEIRWVTGSGTSGKAHHFCPSLRQVKTKHSWEKNQARNIFFSQLWYRKKIFPRLDRGFHPYLAVSRQREIVCIKLGLRAGKMVSKGACCQGQWPESDPRVHAEERTDSCQLSPGLHMCPDPIHINTINLGSSRKAPGIFQDAETFTLHHWFFYLQNEVWTTWRVKLLLYILSQPSFQLSIF